jgi:hypothetical protein
MTDKPKYTLYRIKFPHSCSVLIDAPSKELALGSAISMLVITEEKED